VDRFEAIPADEAASDTPSSLCPRSRDSYPQLLLAAITEFGDLVPLPKRAAFDALVALRKHVR
jgi:hypothetical protein